MTRVFCAIVLCLGLAACGGGSSKSTTPTTPAPPAPPGGGTNPAASTPPAPPVSVAAGSSGVDVTVPGPSTSPVVNAQVLGAAGGGGNSAFSTGDFVHVGTTQAVLLFGPALSAANVSKINAIQIGGSGDVVVVPGSLQGITATNNTPGIAFQVTVAPNAALGARSVFLVSGNDMTVFAGGLEVVP